MSMSTDIRPFLPADEPALRHVMEASLEFDAFPGFTADELDHEVVAMVGAPDGIALAVEDGAGRVLLSVEAQNELALGPYRRTGFSPIVEWPHWTRPVAARPPRGV